MFEFEACLPTRIIAGRDKIESIGEITKPYGDQVLLVTGRRSMNACGITDRVVRSLEAQNIAVELFDRIETNPTRQVMNEAGSLARRLGSSVVIGLGGGSALDAAKGAAIVAKHDEDIWAYVQGKQVEGPGLPIIAVPSTAGTGSETTPYTVISDAALTRKDGFGSSHCVPQVAILDAEVMSFAPPELTAYSGLDALAQAVEAYLSLLAHPFSDMLALESIRLCGKHLEKAYRDGTDLDARIGMAWASSLAGWALAMADVVIGHHVSEAIGAVNGMHHGLAAGLLLAPTMEFNLAERQERLAVVAEALRLNTKGKTEEEKARSAIAAVRNLYKTFRIQEKFRHHGIGEDSFPIVLEILSERTGYLQAANPSEINADSLQRFLEMVY
ncbi:MAG: iron-containing alcohol dehydrogenase [Proteobacteria bacterium]|nr:iron-containing alcohol dehydrogenase [Pseudomonadota bacterium]